MSENYTITITVRLPDSPTTDLEVLVGDVILCSMRVHSRQYPARGNDPTRYNRQSNHRAVQVRHQAANDDFYWLATSLGQAAGYLARLGLDPEPLLALARQRGWEEAIILEAAEFAELQRPTTWLGPLSEEALTPLPDATTEAPEPPRK